MTLIEKKENEILKIKNDIKILKTDRPAYWGNWHFYINDNVNEREDFIFELEKKLSRLRKSLRKIKNK